MNCTQCADVLINFGADPNASDKENPKPTPIDLATVMIAPIQRQTSWTLVSTGNGEGSKLGIYT